jgi:hypothetical protein
MAASRPRCPACGADLGARRRCLACDVELLAAPDEPTGWLAHLRGKVTRLLGDDALELELRSGKTVMVRLSSASRLPPGAGLEAGDEVELLVARLLVFGEGAGGPREAPRQQEQLVARVVASGDAAAALMQRALEERREARPVEEGGGEELRWPEGLRVDPRPGRDGWRLRLHLGGGRRGFPLGLVPVLGLLAFFGYWIWIFAPAWRWLPVTGTAALLVGFLLVRLLRARVIVLDARCLAVQRRGIPWLRRTVLATDEVTAVYTTRDASGHAVEARGARGDREQVLWDLEDGTLAWLVARLLEAALGIAGREPVPGERRPEELEGRLPDLERLLRPFRRQQQRGAGASGPAAGPALDALFEDPHDKVRVQRSGERVILRLATSGIGLWPLAPAIPCGFWLALYHREHLFARELPWPLLDVLACAGALLALYGLVAMIVNHLVLELTPTALRLRRGPLPWPGGRIHPLELVSHLDSRVHSSGKGSATWSLDAILRDGRRVTLVADTSRGLVDWLERRLGEALRAAGQR